MLRRIEREERRTEVLELIDQYEELAKEAGRQWSEKKYNRHTANERFLLFAGIPIITLTVILVSWHIQSQDYGIAEFVMSVSAGLLCSMLVYIFGVTGKIGTYLPLSDRKAIKVMQDEIKQMEKICALMKEERERVAPWTKRFNQLGELIKEGKYGKYELREDVIDDVPDFHVRVKLRRWWRMKKYSLSKSGYDQLKWEIAQCWKVRHCLDDRDEVLREFDNALQEHL